jgi:HPt (histidine-containing phosphotransfer) domain-containing protein
MSKLRVLVVHNDAAELDRIANLLEKGSHAVLPLEKITEASEALELQRFDAVVLPENTPTDELAAFASNLRQLESDRRTQTRTSILSYSNTVTETKVWVNGHQQGYIDALLPEDFEPSNFAETVEQLSFHLSQKSVDLAASNSEKLPVFDLDGFSELLGHSAELLDEIIGLFLDEAGSQVHEMEDCVVTANFDSLAKVAHTLKGSLGTLHAHQARASTQALEIAATQRIQADCETSLERLKADLDELRPLLIEVRSHP